MIHRWQVLEYKRVAWITTAQRTCLGSLDHWMMEDSTPKHEESGDDPITGT